MLIITMSTRLIIYFVHSFELQAFACLADFKSSKRIICGISRSALHRVLHKMNGPRFESYDDAYACAMNKVHSVFDIIAPIYPHILHLCNNWLIFYCTCHTDHNNRHMVAMSDHKVLFEYFVHQPDKRRLHRFKKSRSKLDGP